MIEGTVLMWLEVLTDGKVWDEALDAQRFRRAFVRYAGSEKRSWPIPADIIALLPAREEFHALPAKASDPARAQKYIDDLAAYLNVKTDKPFAGSK